MPEGSKILLLIVGFGSVGLIVAWAMAIGMAKIMLKVWPPLLTFFVMAVFTAILKSITALL